MLAAPRLVTFRLLQVPFKVRYLDVDVQVVTARHVLDEDVLCLKPSPLSSFVKPSLKMLHFFKGNKIINCFLFIY